MQVTSLVASTWKRLHPSSHLSLETYGSSIVKELEEFIVNLLWRLD